MKQKIHRLITRLKNTSRKERIIAGLILGVLIIHFAFLKPQEATNETITIQRGSLYQEVKVTGTTKPFEEVSLAFEQSGRIAQANVRVGSRVGAGQILASLDQGQLLAQRAEQQANVESQRALLQEMQKGSRPEDIQIKQAALATKNQELENQYQGVTDVLNDAYIKTDDAIRKQLDSLFLNDEEPNVQLSFFINNSQLQSDLENKRQESSVRLNAWKKELATISNTADKTILDSALTKGTSNLIFFRDFSSDLMTATNGNHSLSVADLATYKTNINTARTNIAAALVSLNTTVQTIRTDKLAVKQAEADLNRTLAGNTPESIASQAAQVRQVEARVQATDAQIQKGILRAPFSGIITKQDAKAGEIASPNTPVISLISEGKLEIEANVPEADIGKVMVGNQIIATIDAFPGESFPGKLTYIDPAETIIDGVTNFKIKVIFDKNDPRMKSGLTANLTIKTIQKDNVLIVPQYAITENKEGAFVTKQVGTKNVTTSITIGLRGQDGLAEVLSGLNEGDVIIGITNKQ